MIYKYLPIQNIIEKIYRDSASPEELDVWDLYEWIAEALDAIGAYPQYEPLTIEISIENYRGILPCNLIAIEQVSYQGFPCYPSSGTMSIQGLNLDAVSGKSFIRGTEVDTELIPQFSNTQAISPNRHVYSTNDSCIFFDTETVSSPGLFMSYIGIKVDKDGLPLVPDNYWYREACVEYCQAKLDRIEWRKGKIPESVYKDTEMKWERAKNAARGQALMPDLGKMENLKNMLVRLKPNINAFSNFFSSHTYPEGLL